jgi:hypothetical protein
VSKQSCKRGAKKSEQTKLWCRLIIDELKSGEKTSYELEKMFGIKNTMFQTLLVQLTYEAPIYDYKVGGKLFLGILQ